MSNAKGEVYVVMPVWLLSYSCMAQKLLGWRVLYSRDPGDLLLVSDVTVHGAIGTPATALWWRSVLILTFFPNLNFA